MDLRLLEHVALRLHIHSIQPALNLVQYIPQNRCQLVSDRGSQGRSAVESLLLQVTPQNSPLT